LAVLSRMEDEARALSSGENRQTRTAHAQAKFDNGADVNSVIFLIAAEAIAARNGWWQNFMTATDHADLARTSNDNYAELLRRDYAAIECSRGLGANLRTAKAQSIFAMFWPSYADRGAIADAAIESNRGPSSMDSSATDHEILQRHRS